ncbi:secreted RxLR effector protein 161-like [Pyrus communis]|uniref:secreted RxLR effector protein 161-like n=1 Tax=Pyrus communis TaxID=23211 RepID=UPI0035BEDE79
MSGGTSENLRAAQGFDHTPLKWRNLDDVPAQCNLYIGEPGKFEEAAEDESWMNVMENEISMIKKNATWELLNRPTDKPIFRVNKDDDSGPTSEEQYRKIVGSLLYLTATRLDVMYASSLLARFINYYPINKHYGTTKRVLRYIKGTLDYGLDYVKAMNAMLIGFYDSDWGDFVDDSKITSWYAFSFGNGNFSWASVKQNYVALSTAEVEYISALKIIAIWLKFVLEDFGEV